MQPCSLRSGASPYSLKGSFGEPVAGSTTPAATTGRAQKTTHRCTTNLFWHCAVCVMSTFLEATPQPGYDIFLISASFGRRITSSSNPSLQIPLQSQSESRRFILGAFWVSKWAQKHDKIDLEIRLAPQGAPAPFFHKFRWPSWTSKSVLLGKSCEKARSEKTCFSRLFF